jgi:hypothetical protein
VTSGSEENDTLEESLRHRCGGLLRQARIELLVPVIVAIFLSWGSVTGEDPP